VAVAAATGAATVVKRHAGSHLLDVRTKSSPTDLVSEADRASERFIATYIAEHRPDDAINGEEGTAVEGTSGISWAADPLDGTTNFFFGVPAYSVSVAACVDGEPVAGAVVDCCRDEVWSAARGAGAFRGADACHVATGRSVLATALVATGFGYRPERRARQAALVARVISQIRDIRRVGSAALDLCWLAAGHYDAFFELGLHQWDWAAGRLICEEAGATYGALDDGALLVATPDLYAPLSDLLNGGLAELDAGG